MKPETMSNSTVFRGNSLAPYIFGSLAAMFGLVTFALVLVACAYGRTLDNSHPTMDISVKRTTVGEDMEPKIVVIMAGDDNPTFLAEPISSIHK